MALNFADLIGLWTRPLPDGDAAFERFLEFYTDPIAVNGTLMPLRGLVDRARATQRTFSELEGELLAQADAPTHTTIDFACAGDTWARGRRRSASCPPRARWSNVR